MKMRSAEQMQEVYSQLGDKPYVLEYRPAGRLLIFFGSRHVNDPLDPQTRELETYWDKFSASRNKNKHVFCEGGYRPVESLSKSDAIKQFEEAGLVCWLAEKKQIPVTSPEPDRSEAVDYLVQQGYSYEQILAYYFARQMHQWNRSDRKTNPDWRAYAHNLLDHLPQISNWGGLDLSLENVIKIYEGKSDKTFSETDEKSFYNLSDPNQNPVADTSGRLRDEKLLAAIKDSIVFNDVFVVYGSGHAIRLEPALESLVAAKGGE